MSKFIQSRYEAAVLELRSIPFEYTNDIQGPNERRAWYCSTPRIRLNTKHYDIINSLYAFFQYEGYNHWNYDDFFTHIKRVAFEKNWRGDGYMCELHDFAHPDKKSRWFHQTYWYRHKRSYQRKPEHKKKEKREPRWSDSKKSWRKENHNNGWKQHAKRTTTRSIRAEVKKRMFKEDYESLPSNYKKCHWYDYY